MQDARRDKLLSAYIDDELSPRERAQLEQQLETDPALRRRLETLEETVTLLHELPAVSIPRNFILTPKDVDESEPNRTRATRRWVAPLLTAATTVTSLLFILVLAIDSLPINARWGSSAPSPAMDLQMEAPQAMQVEESAEVMVEKEEPVTEQSEALEKAVPQDSLSSGGEAELPAPLFEEEAPVEASDVEEELSVGAAPLSVDPTEGNEAPAIPEPSSRAVADDELGLADAENIEPPSSGPADAPSLGGIPIVAIQVGLGIGSLVLLMLAIQAWRGRHR